MSDQTQDNDAILLQQWRREDSLLSEWDHLQEQEAIEQARQRAATPTKGMRRYV